MTVEDTLRLFLDVDRNAKGNSLSWLQGYGSSHCSLLSSWSLAVSLLNFTTVIQQLLGYVCQAVTCGVVGFCRVVRHDVISLVNEVC